MDWPRRCGSPVCLITPGRRARAGSTGSWPTGMGVTARRRSAGAPCRAGPRSWSVTTCWRAILHLRYLHESWRRFSTSHEFRGNRDWGCPRPLTAPTTLANHTISRQRRPTRSHGALTGPPQTRRPFQTQGMKRALREPCRRRRRGISVPESPHCRTEWHPRSSATISPQIAPRVSLTRCWQRLPLPDHGKRDDRVPSRK